MVENPPPNQKQPFVVVVSLLLIYLIMQINLHHYSWLCPPRKFLI